MGVYLGNTNLTFGKQGKAGLNGKDGQNGLSAYEIAKQQGFSGSEEEFASELANAIESQMFFGRFNSDIVWNDVETEYTQSWTYNGDNYKMVMTLVSQAVTTMQLFINDVSMGTWTITTNENNYKTETVYQA